MSVKPVPLYVVLLHYPMVNRHGQTVTTAVTNLDIHDIARSARTYGALGYLIVTPIEDQQALVGRILAHWRTSQSAQFHPDRAEALSRVGLVRSFEEVKKAIEAVHGELPEVVLTDARQGPNCLTYQEYRRELEAPDRTRPVALVFGTGWGISEVFYPEVHRRLAPIWGPEGESGYNHLSVRAAVAAILDRLRGC